MTNDNGHEYETKTVRVHVPDKGQYVYVMMTRFDGRGGILAREGWKGTYIWYSIISRNDEACVGGADPWALSRRYPGQWFGESPAAALMKDLDMGRIDWANIEDGAHLTPDDIAALAGGDNDD